LDCCGGGLVAQHHSEVQDVIGDLLALIWNQVQKEPVICKPSIDDPTF